MGNELGLKESFSTIMKAFGKYLRGVGNTFLKCLWGVLFGVCVYIAFWGIGSFGQGESINEGESINSLAAWIEGLIKSYLTDDNGLNPFLIVMAIVSLVALLRGLVMFWNNVTKSRFDSMFLTVAEQGTQNFFYGTIVFLVFFVFGLFLVLFKMLEDPSDEVHILELTYVIFSGCLIIYSLFRSIHKRDVYGRNLILSSFIVFFMVVLGVCCPLQKFYWGTAMLYVVFMAAECVYFINKFDTIFRNEEAIYYFRKTENCRLYVHYRLDDERMLCSPDSKLEMDSVREIVDIDVVQKQKLIKELLSSKSKGWCDFLDEIEGIYFLRTIFKYLWLKISGIPGALWNMIKGILLGIKDTVCNIFKNIFKKLSLIRILFIKTQTLKKSLKSKDEELERVKKELEELKKGA